jgi:hypothetical protein
MGNGKLELLRKIGRNVKSPINVEDPKRNNNFILNYDL